MLIININLFKYKLITYHPEFPLLLTYLFLHFDSGKRGRGDPSLSSSTCIILLYVIDKGYFSEAFLLKPRGGTPTSRFKQKAEEESFI